MRRHQTLCLLMLSCVAGHTERLRGEKSGADDGADLQCIEPAEPGMAGAPTGDDSSPVQAGCHCLPPAAQWCSTPVSPAKKAP